MRGNIQMAIFAASNQYRTHDENNRTYQKTQSRRLLVHGIRNKSRLVVESNHGKKISDSTPRHTRHRLDASERHRETIGGQVLTPFKNMKENRKMEKVTVIIEMNNDGSYTAVPQQDFGIGFFGQGSTVEEALADLETSRKEAKSYMPELPEMEWETRFDTASFLQYYSDRLSLAGLQTITGISRKQLSHYVTGHSRPSAATVQKIQAGIDTFSQQLSRVCLI